MRADLSISKSAGAGVARNAELRRRFEMLLATALPPLLTVVTAALTVWLGDLTNGRVSRDHSQMLTPLMTAGAVVLAAAILLDLRALERLPARAAADIRGLLSTSSLGSLAFLAVWVTDQARHDQFRDAGATVLLLCLSTLSICGILLWSTAREIKRLPLRALMLALFVLATVWAEEQCRAGNRGDVEDRMFMLNSLLVALAVALRLC